MSGIEDVIARARQPGELSERKQFSVARDAAIEKMRKFVLADRYHYALELIQAAIANGATFVNFEATRFEAMLSFIGGGFSRKELEQLFDFLFASKDDLEVADIRQLALGVNALLSLGDSVTVTIESGDGTLAGTTQIIIPAGLDDVIIGTPMQALEGTYIRGSELPLQLRPGARETAAIEERCLTAPVPIIINNNSLFGFTSIRTPDLFGYQRVIKFDEGDLYGTIGMARPGQLTTFRLLTYGVWIETVKNDEIHASLGGVIGFDRLRKTADHAAIVKDGVYREMWARLLPYIRQLTSGRTGTATIDITPLGGEAVSVRDYRAAALKHQRVVLFRRGDIFLPQDEDLAAQFGAVLDAPVYLVGDQDFEHARHMGGEGVLVHTPRLERAALNFLKEPVATNPERPWVVAREMTSVELGSGGLTMVSIFTPQSLPDPNADLWVEVRLSGRAVWAGRLSTPFPGHHLVVEMDNDGSARDHAALVASARDLAHRVAREVAGDIEEVSKKVLDLLLDSTEPVAGSAAKIALGALARGTMMRLARGKSGTELEFVSALDPIAARLLRLPLLRTAAGTPVSLRDLERILRQAGGLVYAVRVDAEEAPPPGVDPAQVLAVNEFEERALISLLGEAVYTRPATATALIDAGAWRVNSFGSPLALTAEQPLRIESDGEHLTASTFEACAARLAEIAQSEHLSPAPRHEARKHLIWYAVLGPRDSVARTVPLFRAASGALVPLESLLPALESERGLVMYDGWGMDPWHDVSNVDSPPGVQVALAMDPFALHALQRLGTVTPMLDVASSAGGAVMGASVSFIHSFEVSEPMFEGTLGFPNAVPTTPGVSVWSAARRKSWLVPVPEMGVVGSLESKTASPDLAQIAEKCHAAARGALLELVRQVPHLEPGMVRYNQVVGLLLGYAKRRIRFVLEPDGEFVPDCFDPVARQVLELPLFQTDHQISITGWRVLNDFATFGDMGAHPGRLMLADNLDAELQRWLDEVCSRKHMVFPVRDAVPNPPLDDLGEWLREHLAEFAPAAGGEPFDVRIVADSEFGEWHGESLCRFIGSFREDGKRVQLVVVNRGHWLVRRASPSAIVDPEGASWLLLAIYAKINAEQFTVTNEDELHFQSRVLDWLSSRVGR